AATTAAAGGAPSVLGLPSYYNAGIADGAAIGLIGDWTKAVYGVSGGIEVSVNDSATLVLPNGTDTINLWQDNMFAVRVEVQVGFVVASLDYFRKLTNA
ncbi:MAG: hypothetical protein LBR00_03075, partial [Clostridiales Family XIII bacterium]|nr:hypothetical protein [Clostridiales Family XIII bacterium]